MKHTRIQIYEIQTPEEARQLIDLGVDHIGSVIVSEADWKIPGIKSTIDHIRTSPSRSSLIPLFSNLDSILRALDYYQPGIVHFCESLYSRNGISSICMPLIKIQKEIKKRFPEIDIMRSIPIAVTGMSSRVPTLQLAEMFAPVSDFFLTDTFIVNDRIPEMEKQQPVNGFVGLTGKTCDWELAAELISSSPIPVILAGGISPDNAYDATRQLKPFGIDSCTGTNAVDPDGQSIRFKKDLEKVRRLIDEVRRAEQDLSRS